MLKFFRKIRQNLLSENHFSKYLLYAAGEILLVMIGILLALQVNNWNGNRLTENELTNSFQKLHLDLKSDLLRFHNLDSIGTLRIETATAIQLMLKNKNDIGDIDKIRGLGKQERLGNRTLHYNHGTYDALINTGLLYKSVNENINSRIREYYEQMEIFFDVFNNMSQANRFVRDQEIMIPFRFIMDTSDAIYIPPKNALEWMNNHQHPTYLAVQSYLALYIRQHKDKQRFINRLTNLNESLQQLLIP